MSYIRDPRTFERVPAITLKGYWLAEAGFMTGTPLDVQVMQVMQGCLILTAHAPQPAEPEIMQTLRKVCKLSARKQRQITDLIEAISKPQARTSS